MKVHEVLLVEKEVHGYRNTMWWVSMYVCVGGGEEACMHMNVRHCVCKCGVNNYVVLGMCLTVHGDNFFLTPVI